MIKITSAYLKEYFPNLKDEQLIEDIVNHGELHRFPEGGMVLKDAQYVNHIPLVSKGGVKVVRHTESHQNIFLYFIQPGETCTMTLSSCLKRQTSQVHAQTIAPTEIVLLPVERVYYYTKHFSGWNEFTLQSFHSKFDDIIHAFDRLAFDPLETRIMRFLQDIAALRNDLGLTITHAELAEDMGASRVSVSRVLKELERQGSISLGRNLIALVESGKV
jgi:CRP/FNR family transcriptional regulator